MKVIIAGAGIGGMALAALLRQRGVTAELYERAPSFDHSGYMLSLFPMGSRVLLGLGLREDFLAASARMGSYRACNGVGHTIQSYPFGEALDELGYTGTLMRGELLAMLHVKCADVPLHFDNSVKSFTDSGDHVEVFLSDGSRETCDLLIGADGIHSTVREQLWGPKPDTDSGWGCWVWIARQADRPPTETTEYWGAGRFVGVYPVKGGYGVVAAGAAEKIGPQAVKRDGRAVKQFFSPLGESVADLLAELPDDLAEIFWWKLSDYRCESWVKGRVALLGDAACAFLPTAGVGASMALESAAVLADELSRADERHLVGPLAHYEKRRKQRAEKFQKISRQLMHMMEIESAPLAWGRNEMLKFFSLDMLVKQIAQGLADPI